MRYIIVLVLLTSAVGCVDSRTKRLSSAMRVATDQAEKDRKEAKSEAERKAVDDMYFQHIPRMARLLDDSLHGKKPVEEPIPAVPTDAP